MKILEVIFLDQQLMKFLQIYTGKHRRGEYPFGFNDVLIGFDFTFVISVSRSSDFRIINIAAFRLLLSVLVSEIWGSADTHYKSEMKAY